MGSPYIEPAEVAEETIRNIGHLGDEEDNTASYRIEPGRQQRNDKHPRPLDDFVMGD